MAAAVGTQTETVIIRGPSLGVTLRRMCVSEAVTGLAIRAAPRGQDHSARPGAAGTTPLAAVLSLSLFVACG